MTETIEQIRARFQPLTRGGHQYEIFAERGAILYGKIDDDASDWNKQGAYLWRGPWNNSVYDLLPRSPHEDLIAEADGVLDGVLPHNITTDYLLGLVSRLRDALEQKESDK